MKKILTFLMMFAMTAGILSAQTTVDQPTADQQGPTLSYQLVVRDESNNLVVDQNVNVEVRIESTGATADDVYSYFENFEALHTNHNGMLSLTLGGEGRDGSLTAVNWATARIYITVTETDGNRLIMQLEEPVYAVPYALQSSFLLTTPQIVAYVADWSHGEEDVDAIVAALRSNQPFLTAIRDTVVEYVKNHFDISKQVVRYYMHKVSGDDVREAYNYYETRLNSEVKKAVVNCVKDYLKRHRSMAVELAKYYLRTTNADEIDALYEQLTDNTTVYQFATTKVDVVLDAIMSDHGLDTACLHRNNFSNLCDLQVAASHMSDDPTDICPRFTNVVNSANDGLMALALNQGIIMTAYVKNKQENQAYGFLLSENSIETFADGTEESSVHYYGLGSSSNFGKIVDTMGNSSLCGKTLYARAYMNQTLCTENPEILLSNQMTFTVPTFYINDLEAGTRTVTFSPAEAQTVFNADGRNNRNVWWFDANGTQYDEDNHNTGDADHKGATYADAAPGTYTVVARLGQCYVTKTVTVSNN